MSACKHVLFSLSPCVSIRHGQKKKKRGQESTTYTGLPGSNAHNCMLVVANVRAHTWFGVDNYYEIKMVNHVRVHGYLRAGRTDMTITPNHSAQTDSSGHSKTQLRFCDALRKAVFRVPGMEDRHGTFTHIMSE